MSDDNYSQKIKALAVSLLVFLIAVIITVSAVTSSLGSSVHVVNFGTGDTKQLLTDKELKAVKDALTEELASHNTSGGDISIRWSSYSEPMENRKTFLVDLANIRQTYQITITSGHVWVDCPKPSQTLYPDSFCFTNSDEGSDSIYMTFGNTIPYDGKIADGTSFRLYKDENGWLTVHIYGCSSDEKKQAAKEAVDELVKSLGGNPNIFRYNFLFNNCK